MGVTALRWKGVKKRNHHYSDVCIEAHGFMHISQAAGLCESVWDYLNKKEQVSVLFLNIKSHNEGLYTQRIVQHLGKYASMALDQKINVTVCPV